MTDSHADDPMVKVASLEGVAGNVAYPMDARLKAAQDAIKLLHQRVLERETRLWEITQGMEP